MQNIDCFCSISLTKIVVIEATAELLCVSEQHSGASLLNESTFLNELSESTIQWPTHKDSQLPRFWINWLNEWINGVNASNTTSDAFVS